MKLFAFSLLFGRFSRGSFLLAQHLRLLLSEIFCCAFPFGVKDESLVVFGLRQYSRPAVE